MEKNLRKELHNLYYELVADIEHGECFYDLEMLNNFCANLDQMKEVALKYYNENRIKGEEMD